jgi:hypothetical protein
MQSAVGVWLCASSCLGRGGGLMQLALGVWLCACSCLGGGQWQRERARGAADGPQATLVLI